MVALTNNDPTDPVFDDFGWVRGGIQGERGFSGVPRPWHHRSTDCQPLSPLDSPRLQGDRSDFGSSDAAAVRFAAAAGLVRLARAHDGSLSRRQYSALAEAYCDYHAEPRAALLVKIHRSVSRFLVRLRGGWGGLVCAWGSSK